jgi:hypothetical protein
MFASFGLLILTATMAAGEPDVTPYQLQANCEKLAVETFGRETVDDGDRLDYRAHYSGHLKKCLCRETYISLTPVGIYSGFTCPISQEIKFMAGFAGPPTLTSFTATLKTSNATQKPSGTHL